MGSSASQSAKQTVYCQKHPRNSVTHFCKNTNELLCFNCHGSISRRSGTTSRTIIDVNDYTKSIEFEQSERKTIRSIRTRKDDLEKRCVQAEHTKQNLIQKRETLQRELKEFVEIIIALIQFLEKDMSTIIHSTFQTVLDEIEETMKNMKPDLENVNKIEKEMRKPIDKIVQLQNILRANSITDSLPDTDKRKLPNLSVRLKLNKRLTLKQILGEGKDKVNIRLGDITVNDVDNDVESLDILSDETEGEDSISKPQHKDKNGDLIQKAAKNRFNEHNDLHGIKNQEFNQSRCSFLNQPSTSTGGPTEIAQRGNNSQVNRNGSVSQQGFRPSHRENSAVGVMARRPSSVASTDYNNSPRMMSGPSRLDSRTPRASVQSITTPSGVVMNQAILEADEAVVHTYLERHSYVEIPSAQLTRNITDSIELSDGRLVLCDQKNKQLLLFSSALELKDTCKLTAHPHNMTCMEANRIAITLPEADFIKMVDIVGDIFIDSIKDTPAIANCRGIAQVNNQICHTSKNSIYVYDSGDRYKFERAFKQPVSLVNGGKRSELFVCCRGNKSRGERGEIVSVNITTHKTLCTLSNEYLGEPVSCSLDAAGNLFVCDIQTPTSIHVINRNQYSHRVLGSVGEKFQHIRYLRTRDEFLIAENDSNSIGFYRLKHEC